MISPKSPESTMTKKGNFIAFFGRHKDLGCAFFVFFFSEFDGKCVAGIPGAPLGCPPSALHRRFVEKAVFRKGFSCFLSIRGKTVSWRRIEETEQAGHNHRMKVTRDIKKSWKQSKGKWIKSCLPSSFGNDCKYCFFLWIPLIFVDFPKGF